MVQTQPGTDIQIEEDLDFQRKEWRVERVGWIIMAAIIALAVLGLFGGAGIFLRTTNGTPGTGIWVSFDRFIRFKSPSQLSIYMNPELDGSGKTSFWIDRKYLAKIQINNISPQPVEVEVEENRLTYHFTVSRSDLPIEVIFDITADDIGRNNGRMGMGQGGQVVEFHQFFYP